MSSMCSLRATVLVRASFSNVFDSLEASKQTVVVTRLERISQLIRVHPCSSVVAVLVFREVVTINNGPGITKSDNRNES